MARVQYRLGGTDLQSLGIGVEASRGVLDRPKRKASTPISFPDEHGEIIDPVARPVYEPREIELDCWIRADEPSAFLRQWGRLLDLLDQSATVRLEIRPTQDARPLLYEVYAPEAIQMAKRWRADGSMTGKFTLKLREPEPIGRAYRFEAKTAGARLDLSFGATSPISVHWGDGAHSFDALGDAVQLSHTYAEAGEYFVLLSGDLSALTNLTTPATPLD